MEITICTEWFARNVTQKYTDMQIKQVQQELGTGEQKMENLNAEQIKKALECCAYGLCRDCALYSDDGCGNKVIIGAIELITSQEQRINELTEENERLKADNKQLVNDNAELKNQIQDEIAEEDINLFDEFTKQLHEGIRDAKAGTVRKMQSEIKERCIKGGHLPCVCRKHDRPNRKRDVGGQQ